MTSTLTHPAELVQAVTPMNLSSKPAEKQKLSTRFKVEVLGFLAGLGSVALRNSWFLTVKVHPEAQALLDAGQPVIYAMWHGRMFITACAANYENTALMVSQSTDGEMVVAVAKLLGFRSFARGSSKRKGAEGLRDILKILKHQKKSIMILADGPKGPVFQLKAGAIKAASMTEVPIIPVAGSVKWCIFKSTKTWDNLFVPQFLTPCTVEFGAPIIIPKKISDDELETYRVHCENTLNEMTRKVDKLYGREADSPKYRPAKN